jgi:hypothetical protein
VCARARECAIFSLIFALRVFVRQSSHTASLGDKQTTNQMHKSEVKDAGDSLVGRFSE